MSPKHEDGVVESEGGRGCIVTGYSLKVYLLLPCTPHACVFVCEKKMQTSRATTVT